MQKPQFHCQLFHPLKPWRLRLPRLPWDLHVLVTALTFILNESDSRIQLSNLVIANVQRCMWQLFQIPELQRPSGYICLSNRWQAHAAPVDRHGVWRQVQMNCMPRSGCAANNRCSSDWLLDHKTWDSVDARWDRQSIIHQGCAKLTEMSTPRENLQQPAVNNSSKQIWMHPVVDMLCMNLPHRPQHTCGLRGSS